MIKIITTKRYNTLIDVNNRLLDINLKTLKMCSELNEKVYELKKELREKNEVKFHDVDEFYKEVEETRKVPKPAIEAPYEEGE